MATTLRKFNFLELPGEIRNMIYGHLVIPRSITKVLLLSACKCAPTWKPGLWRPLDLTILRVNRQVHDEATSLLYKEATVTCDLYGRKSDGNNPSRKRCNRCGSHLNACFSTLPLDIIAQFQRIDLTVKLGPDFPLREEWRHLEEVLKRFVRALEHRKSTGEDCILGIDWGDYEFVNVEIRPDDHFGVSRDTQRTYHFRRLSAMLETLDWLFMDISGIKYDSTRSFRPDGEVILEFDEPGRNAYIPIGWGPWWKNPGIIDETVEYMDGSETDSDTRAAEEDEEDVEGAEDEDEVEDLEDEDEGEYFEDDENWE
ncbi:hypothetical protein NA57DRAFT_76762 [Rhizodiscina lignyota]|uniref:F-box domain-containing protein n=1 Tax=Rhizodiscina lignyota TaxID=1504668 RepID=A0A9P4M5E2_9PEZI|nr:hypothetical protein NA57DRAFT_76762 [Rhizodiscina lignyota]